MKLDNKAQSSAEIILLIGGIIAIVLLVGSYISNLTNTTQKSFENLLNQTRNYILNRI